MEILLRLCAIYVNDAVFYACFSMCWQLWTYDIQSFLIITRGYTYVPACPDNCDYCVYEGECTTCSEGYRANMENKQCEIGVLRYRW